MKNLSLRLRIFISYFALITIAAVIINGVATRQIMEATEGAFFDNFDEKNEIAYSTIEDQLYEQLDINDEVRETALHQELTELAEDLEVRITLIDLNGELGLFDTQTQNVDFQLRPTEDIVFLLETDESDQFENDADLTLYRSAYMSIDDDPIFILRVGESYEGLDQQVQRQAWGLGGTTFGIGLLLLILLGIWLANALTQPLTELRTTAQSMAAGNLETRANTQAPPEISLLAEDFNQMATAVEQMVAEQKAFASNAAHELRTPLTAIRLRTETLLEDDPDEALQKRYLTEIQNETERLSRLVEDLRLLSRADAQRLEAGQEQVDVHQLLQMIGREFAATVREKNLTVTQQLPAEPTIMQASTNHIRTILRNIIENAIKYTPDGGSVDITLASDQSTLTFTVHDTGVGIAADDLPQLFNRFYRADKAHSRKIAGSGLGLSLVHSIVKLYDGDIQIASKGLNKGTLVTLRLPLI